MTQVFRHHLVVVAVQEPVLVGGVEVGILLDLLVPVVVGAGVGVALDLTQG